jgi:hypothetical protein
LGADGRLATPSTASFSIKAAMPIDVDAIGILTETEFQRAQGEQERLRAAVVNDPSLLPLLFPELGPQPGVRTVDEGPLSPESLRKLLDPPQRPQLQQDYERSHRRSFQRANEPLRIPGPPMIPNVDQLFQQQMRRAGIDGMP